MEYVTLFQMAAPYMVVASIVFVLYALFEMRMGLASISWREAKGLLLDYEINEHTDPEDDDNVSYSVRVLYSYRARGAKYTSKRLTYNSVSDLSWEEAHAYLGNAKNGDDVTVYYNPTKPSQSVLVKGYGPNSFVKLALGFVVFTVLLLCWRHLR